MKAPRWRLPEAPRPSRSSSRGTAAFFCALGLCALNPSPAAAGSNLLLEPEGHPFCSGAMGPRIIMSPVADGMGGFFLPALDDHRSDLPATEQYDVFMVHLDGDLHTLRLGEGLYADDPCGALLAGGTGNQEPWQAALVAPDRLALVMVFETEVGDDRSQVFVQEYDPQGRELLDRYPVRVSSPLYDASLPVILPDGEGGLFIAWSETIGVQPAYFGISLLQRLDALGRPLWSSPVIFTGGRFGDFVGASLASDGEGGVYVSFWEPRDDETDPNGHVRMQRVSGDGAVIWPAGGVRVWSGGTTDDMASRVIADGSAGAIVLFASVRARAQKMSPAGARLWGDEGIVLSAPDGNDPIAIGTARSAEALAAPDGSLYVTWEEARSYGYKAILVRRLERDGRLPWPAPVPAVAHNGGMRLHRQGLLGDGTLAIVWEDFRTADPSDPMDLYVQAIDPRGRPKTPPGGAPLAALPGRQYAPSVLRPGRPFPTPPGVDGALPQALVVWSDSRLPGPDEGLAESYFAQVVAFSSNPMLRPAATVALTESTSTTIVLHGDDLQPGLAAGAGDGVTVEPDVTPDAPDGPGDTLTLRVSVDPDAAPGPRALTIVNPDGGMTGLAGLIEVGLDPRRVDVDRSGRVDGFDLAVLARAFGRGRAEAGYSTVADVDANGIVDGSDLALLAARFGDSIDVAAGGTR